MRRISPLLFTGIAAALRISSIHTSCSTMPGATPYIMLPKKNHKYTIIFLHGLGDNGAGWMDNLSSDIDREHTKIVCPNSESRHVTLNMGMMMPAWFDLYGLSPTDQEDVDGIQAASRLVHGMIDNETHSAGVPPERIILGGFSMGGALAIYSGLTYGKRLAGIIGISSFLIQRDKLPGSNTANMNTPIFLGHGTNDFLVPVSYGQLTHEKIKVFNPNVELHTYPGVAHTSSPQEMRDIREFASKVFTK